MNLRYNKIGEKGAEYLANSTTLTNLIELNLEGNIIGVEGAEFLSKSTALTNLTELTK